MGVEEVNINPIRDKEQWAEFFTESELRHTGKDNRVYFSEDCLYNCREVLHSGDT